MVKILYRNYAINEEIRNYLIDVMNKIDGQFIHKMDYKDFVILTNDITKWRTLGAHIYYSEHDGTEYFLVSGVYLNKAMFLRTYNYILTYNYNIEAKTDFNNELLGKEAYLEVISLIKKYYTEEEIDAIINKYGEPDYKNEAIHDGLFYDDLFNYVSKDTIIKFENCHYYDLNKAYATCLIKYFPKIERTIKARLLSKNEDIKNKWKKIINYAVGFFNRNKYQPLRKAIVKFINDEITKAVKEVGGELLYLNTDGFIVRNAKKELKTSSNLGEFKEEAIDNNEIYFLRNTKYHKYNIFEYYQNGVKKHTSIGGWRQAKILNDELDLRTNKIAYFEIIRDELGFENIELREINNEKENKG